MRCDCSSQGQLAGTSAQGLNGNCGSVEWPPAPFRVLRTRRAGTPASGRHAPPTGPRRPTADLHVPVVRPRSSGVRSPAGRSAADQEHRHPTRSRSPTVEIRRREAVARAGPRDLSSVVTSGPGRPPHEPLQARHQVRDAVASRRLELGLHLAGGIELNPFVRPRRQSDVAAQLLQSRASTRTAAFRLKPPM